MQHALLWDAVLYYRIAMGLIRGKLSFIFVLFVPLYENNNKKLREHIPTRIGSSKK
jgi:hypothetical protein